MNVLYSAPLFVKDTKVILDGELFLQFKDLDVQEYPPHLGEKSTKLKNGKHSIEIIDSNYNLKKKQNLDLKKQTWVDIIIHDDSISIHLLDKQPHYK